MKRLALLLLLTGCAVYTAAPTFESVTAPYLEVYGPPEEYAVYHRDTGTEVWWWWLSVGYVAVFQETADGWTVLQERSVITVTAGQPPASRGA